MTLITKTKDIIKNNELRILQNLVSNGLPNYICMGDLLVYALRVSKKKAIVNCIISACDDIRIPSYVMTDALELAARGGYLYVVKQILRMKNVHVNENKALLYAARNGNVCMVIDIFYNTEQTYTNIFEAWREAIKLNHTRIVQTLVMFLNAKRVLKAWHRKTKCNVLSKTDIGSRLPLELVEVIIDQAY